MPSVTETGVYTMLAAGVASGVFVAGGRPIWHVVVLVASAVIVIVVLAIISRRAGHPVPADSQVEQSTGDASAAGTDELPIREQSSYPETATAETRTFPQPDVRPEDSPDGAAATSGATGRRGRRRRHQS